MSWTFESRVLKTDFLYLTSFFIACSLILLPSELFWIVIICSSIKFKFIHKIFVIQKFFLLFNLLRGPDITFSGARSGPRVVHPWLNASYEILSTGILSTPLNQTHPSIHTHTHARTHTHKSTHAHIQRSTLNMVFRASGARPFRYQPPEAVQLFSRENNIFLRIRTGAGNGRTSVKICAHNMIIRLDPEYDNPTSV